MALLIVPRNLHKLKNHSFSPRERSLPVEFGAFQAFQQDGKYWQTLDWSNPVWYTIFKHTCKTKSTFKLNLSFTCT